MRLASLMFCIGCFAGLHCCMIGLAYLGLHRLLVRYLFAPVALEVMSVAVAVREHLRLGEDLETVHCFRPRARVPSW